MPAAARAPAAAAPALPSASLAIDAARFDRLAALIEARAGIRMPPSKRTLLDGRLLRCARENGAPSVEAYCDHILSGEAGEDAIVDFINAVTTNKTDFFREAAHFDYLAATILPALRDAGQRKLRAWSAAASTGMEAYTLAMVLSDFAERHGAPDYSILATDIDTRVLETARRGIYPIEALDPVPPAMRARWVAGARDRHRREARIVPALRSKVAFARLNLMDANYPVGDPMDLILCRNVLIYFKKETQIEVVSRLCEQLRPGGHLMLGHSESIHGHDLPLEPVAATIFRRIA